MKTIHYQLNDFEIKYKLENLGEIATSFFLDIETTGFSPKTASIYLIGGCYFKNNHWNLIQWFAANPTEEKEVLEAFFQFLKEYKTIIHFNGNSFDLPFILGRCEKYGIKESFENFAGIDIYKRIFPCRHFLRLPNCKQKTLEAFLGLKREDSYSGGELIEVYGRYTSDRDPAWEHLLLLHNRDDLKGMLMILPVLSYGDLFNMPLQVTKVQSHHYYDLNGQKKQELILRLKLHSLVPVAVSYHANDCYITLEGNHAALRVPVYLEEMKYFYDNYKEYYYLPGEDMAIHKSVAAFVDKNHRVPATKATCYTRKHSTYLPQWDYVFTPFFKREYRAKLLFFELTEEFKTNREAFCRYASHILHMLGKSH